MESFKEFVKQRIGQECWGVEDLKNISPDLWLILGEAYGAERALNEVKHALDVIRKEGE